LKTAQSIVDLHLSLTNLHIKYTPTGSIPCFTWKCLSFWGCDMWQIAYCSCIWLRLRPWQHWHCSMFLHYVISFFAVKHSIYCQSLSLQVRKKKMKRVWLFRAVIDEEFASAQVW